jgi:hypothetical protein
MTKREIRNIEVIVERAICEALSSKDYLIDKENGQFNSVCYEVIKKNWASNEEQLEEFYLRCTKNAYRIASDVLMDSKYYASWGRMKNGDKYSFVLPNYVTVEDNSLEESEFLKTMLPMLWHILYRVDFGLDIVKHMHIYALCYQIKKMFMNSKESQSFFRELNDAFKMRRDEIDVSSVWYLYHEIAVFLCRMRNLVSISRKKSMFVPLVQKVYDDDAQHTALQIEEKSKDELVKQAIIAMFEKTYSKSEKPIFSEQYQWRAIHQVLKEKELTDKNICEFVEWINSFDGSENFRVRCTKDSLKKKKGVEYDEKNSRWILKNIGKSGDTMCKLLNKMNSAFRKELKLLGL